MTKRAYNMAKRAETMAATRRKIVDAAVELFWEQGPARTTVSEIAKSAGVGRVTVYNHFPDDEALYTTCYEQLLGEYPLPPLVMLARVEEDPVARLRVVLSALYAWYGDTAQMTRQMQRDAATLPALRKAMRPTAQLIKAMRERLTVGWPAAGKRLTAAVELALRFETWDILTGPAGLTDTEAIALMVDSVRAAGRADALAAAADTATGEIAVPKAVPVTARPVRRRFGLPVEAWAALSVEGRANLLAEAQAAEAAAAAPAPEPMPALPDLVPAAVAAETSAPAPASAPASVPAAAPAPVPAPGIAAEVAAELSPVMAPVMAQTVAETVAPAAAEPVAPAVAEPVAPVLAPAAVTALTETTASSTVVIVPGVVVVPGPDGLLAPTAVPVLPFEAAAVPVETQSEVLPDVPDVSADLQAQLSLPLPGLPPPPVAPPAPPAAPAKEPRAKKAKAAPTEPKATKKSPPSREPGRFRRRTKAAEAPPPVAGPPPTTGDTPATETAA